ncbi:MAG TPA: hypothetical protein VH370_06305, partial [Humisphaera sp.]|nr:hypothetical protein [Humisphaera sp.]
IAIHGVSLKLSELSHNWSRNAHQNKMDGVLHEVATFSEQVLRSVWPLSQMGQMLPSTCCENAAGSARPTRRVIVGRALPAVFMLRGCGEGT